MQRKLDEKIEKRYRQIAEQDGIKKSFNIKIWNSAMIMLGYPRYLYNTEACMAFNELREKYPRGDYVGVSEDYMVELECPELKERLN